MQEHVKLFVKIFSELIPTESPIYEFGSLQVPKQEGFADLRCFFPGREYVGCDMQAGPGVDRIEDMEKGLTIRDDSASVILCMETLEHVFHVQKALSEMTRILKSNDGILVASSLFRFKIHSYPYDYWRFTPYCFARLFSEFDISMTGAQGDPDNPVSVFAVGVKTKDRPAWRSRLLAFQHEYEAEFRKRFRYDESWQKKIKLSFYRAFVQKQYARKMERLILQWSIQEKNG